MMTTEEWNDKPTGNATVVQLYTEAELQAAIAAAMMGAAADQDKTANWWSQEVDRRVAICKGMSKEVAMASGRLAGHMAAARAIHASIPPDALAALEAVKAQVRTDIAAMVKSFPRGGDGPSDALEREAWVLGQIADAIAKGGAQ